jgi:hypothetical protein
MAREQPFALAPPLAPDEVAKLPPGILEAELVPEGDDTAIARELMARVEAADRLRSGRIG